VERVAPQRGHNLAPPRCEPCAITTETLKLPVLSALVALLAALGSAPTAAAAPRDDRSRPLVYVFVLDGLDGDRVRQRPMSPPS